MAGILKGHIKALSEVEPGEVVAALKAAGFAAKYVTQTFPKHYAVAEYDAEFYFSFSKQYGGTINVINNKNGERLLSDLRTKKTLIEAVVGYFADRQENIVRHAYDAIKVIHSDRADEREWGAQKLKKIKETNPKQSKKAIAIAEKRYQEDEEKAAKKPPTKVLYLRYGTFEYLASFPSMVAAVKEGQKREKADHMCVVRVHGRKTDPQYALYVSLFKIPEGVANPDPLVMPANPGKPSAGPRRKRALKTPKRWQSDPWPRPGDAIDEGRKAKLPGRRVAEKSGKVYYERRRNRSDMPWRKV